MNLESGTKIERYVIRSLLGSGGMGEVYSAYDTQLERIVALKLLKQTQDPDKLKRFRQEAKTVSSINHPNILTVYDFGQYEDFHFIVTELIGGKTLRQMISENELSLDDVLNIGIQTGNALVAAHQAGVIHRDLKPENIMILPDGYVKVLDFGLAKLVGQKNELADISDASTTSLVNTKAGIIVGTVHYMSPEQLRGQILDERADIWSLGVILFELLAGKRPFQGESASDVIASILQLEPLSLREITTGVPPELNEAINRALQKKKEERYQTANEFVAALKNIKLYTNGINYAETYRETRQLSSKEITPAISTRSDDVKTKESETGVFNSSKKSAKRWQIVTLISALILSGLSLWFFALQPLTKTSLPPKTGKVNRLTTTGNISNAVISPDGRFFVYVLEDAGKQSLWLKQVSETAGKELIPPEAKSSKSYSNLAFAPDVNFIYFSVFGQNAFGKLYRIPILGGTPQQIAENVDSNVSFSPDGKRLAFLRKNTSEGRDRIIIADSDGGNARILAERKMPDFYSRNTREGIAWSPDGETIACPAGSRNANSEYMTVIEVDTQSGREREMTAQKWSSVGKVAWVTGKRELIITAADFGTDLYQIVRISPNKGQSEKITNELNDYVNISISADAKFLLAVASSKISNIFRASIKNLNQAVQIARGTTEGANGLMFAPDGKIIYVSTESGNKDIWKMNEDGSNRQQLTFDKASDEYPSISADGKYLVFTSTRTGMPQIWRMNINDNESQQLTDKNGGNFPQIVPDGKFVVYSTQLEGRPALWKIPIEGGVSLQLTKEQTNWAAISPDGKLIACLALIENSQMKLAVLSIDDGVILQTFDFVGTVAEPKFPPAIRWTADGKAISYVSTSNGVSNIWMQSLTGDKPKRLTDFSADRIYSFDWSWNGKQIVYARGSVHNDAILFEDF